MNLIYLAIITSLTFCGDSSIDSICPIESGRKVERKTPGIFEIYEPVEYAEFCGEEGGSIYAISKGEVVNLTERDAEIFLLIKNGGTITAYFGDFHLLKIAKGDQVNKGQEIAKIGDSGCMALDIIKGRDHITHKVKFKCD